MPPKRKRDEDDTQSLKRQKMEVPSMSTDVLSKTLQFLDGFYLCKMRLVSKTWANVIEENDWLFRDAIKAEGINISPLSFRNLDNLESKHYLADDEDVISALEDNRDSLSDTTNWRELYLSVMNDHYKFINDKLYLSVMNDHYKFINDKLQPNVSEDNEMDQEKLTYIDHKMKIEEFERKNKIVLPSLWKMILLKFGAAAKKLKFTSQEEVEVGELMEKYYYQVGFSLDLITSLEQNKHLTLNKYVDKELGRFGDNNEYETADVVSFVKNRASDENWFLFAEMEADEHSQKFFVNCDITSKTFGQVADAIRIRDCVISALNGGYFKKDMEAQLKEIVKYNFAISGVDMLQEKPEEED
jgi:hypothetical protein